MRRMIIWFVVLQNQFSNKGASMKKQSEEKKTGFLTLLSKNYSGPITHVAISALSAWMIVTGLKGLLGFTVNSQTAMADLVGIVIVVGIVRWMKVKQDAK